MCHLPKSLKGWATRGLDVRNSSPQNAEGRAFFLDIPMPIKDGPLVRKGTLGDLEEVKSELGDP
jgi:hypothetical protein